MDRHSAPTGQRSAILISTPYDSDKAVTQDMVKCCHCGRQWLWQPGSGRRRGWCTLCHGITCGNHKCASCVPLEQQLENMEAGRALDHRPILARAS